MPVKIGHYNERVAEAQFICDYCGKVTRTSLISRHEAESQKNTKIICWQCKKIKPDKQ